MSANIFSNIPGQLPQELFENLLDYDTIKIERIVSHGHSTPDGQWYDQPWDEWVLLLQGQATLSYEDGSSINLQTGDYLLISAHTKHRVEFTAQDQNTLWLAVHIHQR